MSIRFDADGEYLIRTTDLPNYNSPWTWMAWYYHPNLPATYANPIYLAYESYQNSDQILENAGGAPKAQGWVGGSSVSSAEGSVSAETWYHFAFTRDTDYKVRFYINGALVGASGALDPAGRTAPNEMAISGTTPKGGQYIPARIAFAKCWAGVALSEAQIDAEQLFAAPQAETGSVYGWWKFKTTTDLNDYSVNGRNWTANGSISTEADPPDIDEGEAATFTPRIIMIS